MSKQIMVLKILLIMLLIFSLGCAKRTRNPYDPINKEVPSSTAIIVNNGKKYTNNSEVSLILQAYNAFKVKIANTREELEKKEWELFKSTKTNPHQMEWSEKWELSEPTKDGEKTIYAKFIDKAGNETNIIQTNISLDTVLPSEFSTYIKIGYSQEEAVAKTWFKEVRNEDEVIFTIKSNEKNGEAKIYLGYITFKAEETPMIKTPSYPAKAGQGFTFNNNNPLPRFFEDTIEFETSKPSPKKYTSLKLNKDFEIKYENTTIGLLNRLYPILPREYFTLSGEFIWIKFDYIAFPVILLEEKEPGIYTGNYIINKEEIDGRAPGETKLRKKFLITWLLLDKSGNKKSIINGEIGLKFEPIQVKIL